MKNEDLPFNYYLNYFKLIYNFLLITFLLFFLYNKDNSTATLITKDLCNNYEICVCKATVLLDCLVLILLNILHISNENYQQGYFNFQFL